MTAGVVLATVLSTMAQLEVRPGVVAPEGRVTDVSIEGVTVGDRVIAWDRVRSVGGEFGARAEAFRPVADAAWRARSRLERGDLGGAEVLLERFASFYAGRRGPTAAMFAEGLVRVRLAHGAVSAAVPAWLAWLACDTPPVGSMITLGTLPTADRDALPWLGLDETTGLVHTLPPMWLPVPSSQAIATLEVPPSVDGIESPRSIAAGRLAALYRCAVRYELGLPFTLPTDGNDSPAVAIVREIVVARVGESAERAAARDALSARLNGASEPWLEAWLHAAIGRSLAREDDAELKRLAVVELLTVPARFENEIPYLTGLALAEGAVAARAIGDREGADRLIEQLVAGYPGHPATGWSPIRLWSAATPKPVPQPKP